MQPTSPTPPQPASSSRRRTWLAVLAIVALLVLASATVYVAYVAPSRSSPINIPAHVTDYLSNGSILLDVPLMTIYTAPALQNQGLETNVSLSMSSAYGGPSTTFTFLWGDIRGTNESVRFVLTPTVGSSQSTAFDNGPVNGFLAFPGGNRISPGESQRWGSEDATAGMQAVVHELWRMNYGVTRNAATVIGVPQSWIEVNYSLLSLLGFGGDPLPAANVSLPRASDLLPVGGIMNYNLSEGDVVGELAEVHNFGLPASPFRHTLPAITLDAGAAGLLTVTLSSEFRWGPAESNWLGWTLTPAHTGSLRVRYSVDTRFGSLTVQFLR
jgi:hypothetical protein